MSLVFALSGTLLVLLNLNDFLLTVQFSQLLFLEDHVISLGHHHALREFFKAHYLHDVFFVLLHEIAEFMFIHQCDFAEFESYLETLLKLKFFLLIFKDVFR